MLVQARLLRGCQARRWMSSLRPLRPKEDPLDYLKRSKLYGRLLRETEIQGRSPLFVEATDDESSVDPVLDAIKELGLRIGRLETRVGAVETSLGDHSCKSLLWEFDYECRLRYDVTFAELLKNKSGQKFQAFISDFSLGGRKWTSACEEFLMRLKEINAKRFSEAHREYSDFEARFPEYTYLLGAFRSFIDRTAPQ